MNNIFHFLKFLYSENDEMNNANLDQIIDEDENDDSKYDFDNKHATNGFISNRIEKEGSYEVFMN